MSIVLELQEKINTPSVLTSSILNHAYIVARKLKNTEITDWLNNERNGYPDTDVANFPEYRRVKAVLTGKHPYYGSVPFIMPYEDIEEKLTQLKNAQSIIELEGLIESGSPCFEMPLDTRVLSVLLENINAPMEITRIVQRTDLVRIVTNTRSLILDWALGLEEQGILGDGMSFTIEDQKKSEPVTMHIKNMINGNVSNSQIQQDSEGANQAVELSLNLDRVREIIENIKDHVDELELSEEHKKDLNSDIVCIEAQLSSSSPKQAIIKECLDSIRNIIEGAAGSGVFHGIMVAVQQLLQ